MAQLAVVGLEDKRSRGGEAGQGVVLVVVKVVPVRLEVVAVRLEEVVVRVDLHVEHCLQVL